MIIRKLAKVKSKIQDLKTACIIVMTFPTTLDLNAMAFIVHEWGSKIFYPSSAAKERHNNVYLLNL